jgi:hypothetical protein
MLLPELKGILPSPRNMFCVGFGREHVPNGARQGTCLRTLKSTQGKMVDWKEVLEENSTLLKYRSKENSLTERSMDNDESQNADSDSNASYFNVYTSSVNV